MDILSTLPEEILINNLRLTKSYRCAVRCSALSQRWMFLYQRIPSLYIDEEDFVGRSVIEQKRTGKLWNMEQQSKVMQRVATALFRHIGDIESLELTMCTDKFMFIAEWCLQYASAHNIRHVAVKLSRFLGISAGSQMLHFPLVIYSCSTLVSLAFDGHGLEAVNKPTAIVAAYQSFPNLRVCHLKMRKLSPSWISDFLSRCPVITHLILSARDFIESTLTISSPTLSFLKIEHPFQASAKLKLKLQANSLLQLDVDIEFDLEYIKLPNLKQVRRAKWNKYQKLVYLDYKSRINLDNVASLKTISGFSALLTLKLSQLKVPLSIFWAMLTNLWALKFLELIDCSCTVNRNDMHIWNDKGHIQQLADISVKEVRIRLYKYGEENLPFEEKQMLRLFLAGPRLQSFSFSVGSSRSDLRSQYVSFFDKLSSSLYANGRYLKLKETNGQIEFCMVKKLNVGHGIYSCQL